MTVIKNAIPSLNLFDVACVVTESELVKIALHVFTAEVVVSACNGTFTVVTPK